MNPTLPRGRGFTLVELLVVIAIIAIVAGLVVPSLMNAQSSAFEIQCVNNLRGIQQVAFLYAQGRTKAFPIAKMKDPPAHESLNVLIRTSHGANLDPDIFICPEGEAVSAESDAMEDTRGAGFLLDDFSLSYTWVRARTRVTKKALLSSDKYYGGYEDEDGPHEGHSSRMNCVDVSGKAFGLEILPDGEFEETRYRMSEDGIPVGLIR